MVFNVFLVHPNGEKRILVNGRYNSFTELQVVVEHNCTEGTRDMAGHKIFQQWEMENDHWTTEELFRVAAYLRSVCQDPAREHASYEEYRERLAQGCIEARAESHDPGFPRLRIPDIGPVAISCIDWDRYLHDFMQELEACALAGGHAEFQ